MALVKENDGTGKSLRISGDWQRMMQDRISQIKDLIERDQGLLE